MAAGEGRHSNLVEIANRRIKFAKRTQLLTQNEMPDQAKVSGMGGFVYAGDPKRRNGAG
jgi:hypothetical protein